MISHALSHGKVRYEEAYDLYQALYRESRSVINSLARVLPQVGNAADARNLVFVATDGDKSALVQVPSYCPNFCASEITGCSCLY